MTASQPAAMVLWTGGKDSAMALELSRAKFNVIGLATFAPASAADFKAHPIELMRHQADSLGLPHHLIPIVKPYRDSYVAGLKKLVNMGARSVITGDIAPVDGHNNWIRECASGIVDTCMPLWSIDRIAHLAQIDSLGFHAIVSLARRDRFTTSIVGRVLDTCFIKELIGQQAHGIDPCGENGEYHTNVLNGPGFSYGLELINQTTVTDEQFWQLDWTEVRAKANRQHKPESIA